MWFLNIIDISVGHKNSQISPEVSLSLNRVQPVDMSGRKAFSLHRHETYKRVYCVCNLYTPSIYITTPLRNEGITCVNAFSKVFLA
jgi:hypothetical protein